MDPTALHSRESSASRLPNFTQGYNVEMMTKVRDLESNLIDMKGAMDRKLATLMEEIPARMTRELKAVEDKEAFVMKDTKSRVQNHESLLNQLKAMVDKEIGGLSTKVEGLSSRVDDNRFKVGQLQQQVDGKLDLLGQTSRLQKGAHDE